MAQPRDKIGRFGSTPVAAPKRGIIDLTDSTALVVSGDGPWRCKVQAKDSADFRWMVKQVKAVPGARFDGGTKEWVIPAKASAGNQLADALATVRSMGLAVVGDVSIDHLEQDAANVAPLNGSSPASTEATYRSKPLTSYAAVGTAADSKAIRFGIKYEQHELRKKMKDSLPILWDHESKTWTMSMPHTAEGWDRLEATLNELNIGLDIDVMGHRPDPAELLTSWQPRVVHVACANIDALQQHARIPHTARVRSSSSQPANLTGVFA